MSKTEQGERILYSPESFSGYPMGRRPLKGTARVRIAEVDYDPTANYGLGHVPGAALFDWKKDINDPVSRNILSKQACEDLLQKLELMMIQL